MKYTRGQFTNEYYQLWELGLLLPVPKLASVFSVKYRKNHFDEYSRVTLKAASVADALERACYAITYASPWRPEDIDLHAVYDEEENLLWIDEPFYEVVQKKNEFRGMERREFIAKFGMTAAAILFGLRPLKALAGTSVTLGGTASGFIPTGEQLYTTAGSFNWTVPNGVTSVCVVCVGSGGGPGAGSGGGLGYKNNISVASGGSQSVIVGAGVSSGAGQDSYFSSPTVVRGIGGLNTGYGGGFIGAGGGVGGNAGSGSSSPFAGDSSGFGGGGGAGGYSGNGGNGGNNSNGTRGQGGGGVGLYGQGNNGGGGGGATAGSGGGGGGGHGLDYYSNSNGGSSGSNGSFSGGLYGGGYMDAAGSTSGSGAVRIIWGVGRSFPSNAS